MYCDLVEAESFTKAARINQVTQSAVSQQVSALERLFKSRLIERSKKQFRLTREGQVLYESGKQILQTYETLHNELQVLKDMISGSIRVAAMYSIGLHLLPPFIKKYMQNYPTVNVHVEYRHADQVYEDIQGNAADLGLVSYPVKDGKLEIVSLGKEPLVLICPPQHALARQKSVKLKALEGLSMVSFEPDMASRRAVDKVLREQRVSVKHAMEFDNVETVKRAVEIGYGISIVPQSAVGQEVQNRTLAAVAIDHSQLWRPLAAIYKRNRVLSPAIKQFLATLKGEA
jgi:DNA-binding transcriptional LysR family regulator